MVMPGVVLGLSMLPVRELQPVSASLFRAAADGYALLPPLRSNFANTCESCGWGAGDGRHRLDVLGVGRVVEAVAGSQREHAQVPLVRDLAGGGLPCRRVVTGQGGSDEDAHPDHRQDQPGDGQAPAALPQPPDPLQPDEAEDDRQGNHGEDAEDERCQRPPAGAGLYRRGSRGRPASARPSPAGGRARLRRRSLSRPVLAGRSLSRPVLGRRSLSRPVLAGTSLSRPVAAGRGLPGPRLGHGRLVIVDPQLLLGGGGGQDGPAAIRASGESWVVAASWARVIAGPRQLPDDDDAKTDQRRSGHVNRPATDEH